MIPSDPGIKCGDGFSAFSRFFGWRFEPFLLFRSIYTTPAGIMQGEPGQRRTVYPSYTVQPGYSIGRSRAARTFFTVPSSFTARPFFAARTSFAAEFSFGFPWGMWKRGLGLWIRELLSAETEQGFRWGIAGLWEEWVVFCGKKEKYAENILLFCTFYWYQ